MVHKEKPRSTRAISTASICEKEQFLKNWFLKKFYKSRSNLRAIFLKANFRPRLIDSFESSKKNLSYESTASVKPTAARALKDSSSTGSIVVSAAAAAAAFASASAFKCILYAAMS